MLRPLLWLFVVCVFTQRRALAEDKSDSKFGGGTRIVDGTPVDGSEYPWIASLYLKSWDCLARGNHFCGGSVFDVSTRNRTWILTAAHCMERAEEEIVRLEDESKYGCKYKLYADIGRDDTDDFWETGYESLRIDGWKTHENHINVQNDVAIAWTIDSANVEPVALQTSSPCCVADEPLRVIGYGHEEHGGDPTDTLEYVDLKYVEAHTCEEMLDENVGHRWHIRDGMSCSYDEGHGACQGDSGGPLLAGTDAGATQVALVSWGYGCARNLTPGVYMDVGYYYDWINETQYSIEDLGGHKHHIHWLLLVVIIVCAVVALCLLLTTAYCCCQKWKKAKRVAVSRGKSAEEYTNTGSAV